MFKYLALVLMLAGWVGLSSVPAYADGPRHAPRVERSAKPVHDQGRAAPARPHRDHAHVHPRVRHRDPAHKPPRAHHRDRGVKVLPPLPRHERRIAPLPRAHIRPRGEHRWHHYLPHGFIHLTIDALDYYYTGGLFYQPYLNGYVSVELPIGSVIAALPSGYRIGVMDTGLYYALGDTYFVEVDGGYQVIANPTRKALENTPATPPGSSLYIYPSQGQSAEQQASDRYACHRWGAEQSGFDPSVSGTQIGSANDYKRAMSACLEARGYTVK